MLYRFFLLSALAIGHGLLGASANQLSPTLSGQGNLLESMLDAQRRLQKHQFVASMLEPHDSMSASDRSMIQFCKPLVTLLNGNTISMQERAAIMKKVFTRGHIDPGNPATFSRNLFAVMQEEGKIPQSVYDSLSASMIEQSQKAVNKSLWTSIAGALKMGMLVGLVDCMEKVISESFSRVINKIPNVFGFISRIAGKGYNALCKRPGPLLVEEVLIWENTFEGVINSLCEQTTGGNLMLRNVRIGDEDQKLGSQADANWLFFVELVNNTFEHIVTYFDTHMPFYMGDKQQRQLLVALADSVSIENKVSIAFIARTIKNNLSHIVGVCKKASSHEELDITHIRQLSRITLLLFKKLRLMLDQGQGVQASQAQLMPGTGNGGSALIEY